MGNDFSAADSTISDGASPDSVVSLTNHRVKEKALDRCPAEGSEVSVAVLIRITRSVAEPVERR
jgi:hypothetical protein